MLKGDITTKQKVIDSILEHSPNLLYHKMRTKKSKNRDSNSNNTNVTAQKKNYNKYNQKTFESNHDKVRDNKIPKRDIVTIGDSIIQHMSNREM